MSSTSFPRSRKHPRLLRLPAEDSAGLGWDSGSAHSATYDAERTAELFCTICNELAGSFRWAENRARDLGWHEPAGTAGDGSVDIEGDA